MALSVTAFNIPFMDGSGSGESLRELKQRENPFNNFPSRKGLVFHSRALLRMESLAETEDYYEEKPEILVRTSLIGSYSQKIWCPLRAYKMF